MLKCLAGVGSFSVSVSGSQAEKMQRNKDAYFATRTSFIPFFTVYLADPPSLAKNLFDLEIPTPFKIAHRKRYEDFFQRFGSHYVKRAWIGGKAMLTFSVLKSSNISEEQIRAGIQASYSSVGSGSANTTMSENKQNLMNNSECEVTGQGGDPIVLASLNSLDEQVYNQWVQSVKENPQSIELEVAGIWNLIEDEAQAQALIEAYKNSSVFEPITAITCIEQTIYLIRNSEYSTYNSKTGVSVKSQGLDNKWPELYKLGFHRIDACLSGDYLGSVVENPISNKTFFFHQSHYVVMNSEDNSFEAPKHISEGFPGVEFNHIDAALHFEPNLIYLFSGNQYVRFNLLENRVEDGYPALIKEHWGRRKLR